MRARRFLNAYSKIEKYFQQNNKTGKHYSFANSVNFYAQKNDIIRTYRDDLLEYGQLRNAIVHDRVDDTEIIAEPHEKVVQKIERIAEMLTKPITLEAVDLKELLVCQYTDYFADVLKKMAEKGYSQVPVLDGVYVINVLSSSMIVHYMYEHIDKNMIRLEGVKISDVLEDSKNHFQLIHESQTILETIELFGESSTKGKVITALVVLNDQSSKKGPIGILTPKDIPRLLTAIINR